MTPEEHKLIEETGLGKFSDLPVTQLEATRKDVIVINVTQSCCTTPDQVHLPKMVESDPKVVELTSLIDKIISKLTKPDDPKEVFEAAEGAEGSEKKEETTEENKKQEPEFQIKLLKILLRSLIYLDTDVLDGYTGSGDDLSGTEKIK